MLFLKFNHSWSENNLPSEADIIEQNQKPPNQRILCNGEHDVFAAGVWRHSR
jgi:hypothetical protein